jgi:hypothetical protein
MDLKDLLFDSSRRSADMAVSVIGNNPEIFRKFLDFAMQDNSRYAMRAARVIQIASHNYPELVRPYLKEIILRLPDLKNDGLKRGMAKILIERSFDHDEETLGILVATCFDWLMDPAQKPAIKVYSMEILYKVSQVYPEIKNELISSIEEQLPRSGTAVKSRGKQILAKFYKQTIG